MIHRRSFIKYVSGTGFVCFTFDPGGIRRALAEPIPIGILDPGVMPKYLTPMLIPPATPRGGADRDHDEIAARRAGPGDEVMDARTGARAVLPGPARPPGGPPGAAYFDLPIAVQDRSFNADGSLFDLYARSLFDGPWLPDAEVSPIWSAEVFGNTLLVNGNTWPFQVVEQRRYRLRLLNACQARFLFLEFGEIAGARVWQIGNEGGFLAAPVDISGHHNNRVLLAPAERADCIVDFTRVPVGHHLLRNVGPDEPFSGGTPDVDFLAADRSSTGQVLQFRVVPATAPDRTTPPRFLRLPTGPASPRATVTRRLARLEEMSMCFADPRA